MNEKGLLIAGGVGAAAIVGGPLGMGAALLGAALLFGGEETSRMEVSNTIKNIVENTQKNMVSVATQSTVNVTHTIVQEQIATIVNNVDARNSIEMYEVIVSNGAYLNIEQQNNLQSTVQAILNITTDSKIVSELSSKIKNNIKSTLAQNVDLANNVAASADLIKAQQNDGELNNLVSKAGSIVNTLGSLVSGSNTNNLTVKNDLLNQISQHSEAQTNINNFVATMVNESINQKSLNECTQSSNLSNIIELKQIVVDGPDSTFEIVQGNILNSFYHCVITAALKTEDYQNLGNETLNSSSIDNTQGAKVKNDLKAGYTKIDEKTASSYLDSMGVAIVVLVVVIIIVIIVISKS